MSRYIPKDVRALVKERAKACCEYCYSQEFFSADSFTVDHILPYSKGGSNEENNLAFACQGCNRRKHNHKKARDPYTRRKVPLYNPREHTWSDHFRWSEDYLEIKGISATGRATVALLAINREGVTNLREVLAESGEHPPSPFNY